MGREGYMAMEGIIKCGKSTQRDILAAWIREHCLETELVVTFEPGGSEIADHLRSTVQGEIAQSFSELMTTACEVGLYASSRGQTLPSIVTPALERGALVLSDRSFITSGAYQGFGREWGIEKVMAVNRPIVGDVTPGLALFLDTPLPIALKRSRDLLGDKFEKFGDEFFIRARHGYLWMIDNMPELNLVRIDGEGSVEEVNTRIVEVVKRYLGLWGVGMLGL